MSAAGVVRGALVVSSLIYLGLGLAFMLDPVGTIAVMQLEAPSAAARVELRAMYGGLELGLAAWLAWTAWRPERFTAGLSLVAMSLGGLGLARLAGLLIEGDGWGAHGLFLGIELGSTALALGLLAWWLRSQDSLS